MKRILSILLIFMMLLSLVSCDINVFLTGVGSQSQQSQSESEPHASSKDDEESSEEDEESSEEDEESSEEDEESSEEDEESSEEDEDYEQDEDYEDEEESSSTPVIPSYGADTTPYTNKVTSEGKWVYGTTTLMAPIFTNYYHGYQSALSMTFDDGYDSGTGAYVSDIFEKYGFRGTAMLGPCFLDDDLISEWNKTLARGYLDVGCHGYDHKEPTNLSSSEYEHEIKDAIDYLKENFPTQNVLTFATPYAHINSSYETYLKNYAISNRLEMGGEVTKIGSTNNLYRVKAYSFNKSISVSAINAAADQNLKVKGTWFVELIHCVLDTPYNNTDLSKSAFAEHCEYIYNTYKDKVWVASFEDVSIYLKQYENAKINYTAADKESLSFNITCDLDKDVYNIPMTIKLYIPSRIKTAYAVIDGEEQLLTVNLGSGTNAVVIKDIPVNGSDVKVYFGGNSFCNNGCGHDYIEKTTKATCDSFGYTTATCFICENTYKHSYTEKKSHDFSGERVVEKEATTEENGLITVQCLNCTLKKEIVTKIQNISPEADITATEGKNEWTHPESMIDEKPKTEWVCGTSNPEVVLTFLPATVKNVKVTLSRFPDVNQQFTLYVTDDGTNWYEVDTWIDAEDESEDDPITLTFDVDQNVSGVKLYFDASSSGCTKIQEIEIYAFKETE